MFYSFSSWWFSFSDSCKHAHEMKWVKKTSKYFSFKWLSYFGCSVLLLFSVFNSINRATICPFKGKLSWEGLLDIVLYQVWSMIFLTKFSHLVQMYTDFVCCCFYPASDLDKITSRRKLNFFLDLGKNQDSIFRLLKWILVTVSPWQCFGNFSSYPIFINIDVLTLSVSFITWYYNQ